MGIQRLAAVAALSSSLIIAVTGPATADPVTDTIAPIAGSISPDDGTTVGALATITVSGVSPDTARVTLSYGYGTGATILSTATAAPWTLQWDTAGRGTFTAVYVTVADRAGNTTFYQRNYKIDRVGPEVWATTNWIPAVIGTGVGQIGVSYEDPSDVSRIEWWIDGVLKSTTQIARIDFGRVNRTAAVEARIYDALGNVTVESRKVRVDATPPTITAVTPAHGALVRGDTLATEIKATDASGVYWVVMTDPYNLQHDLNPPYRKPVPIMDGPKHMSWQVYDRLWNVTVVRRTVIVDNHRPTLNVAKAPKNGAKVKGTVQIAATAWDRYGVARVELLINGKVAVRDYAAAYQFSINTKKYGKTIKVQLRAYDKVGNMTWTPVRTWKR